MKLGNIGLFATPENVKALEDYLSKFNGSEGVVASTVMGMTWNLCAKLTANKDAHVLTAYEFTEVIRKAYSMSKDDYEKCFGEDLGGHYYTKFTKEFEGNVGKLICNMDTCQVDALIKFKRS